MNKLDLEGFISIQGLVDKYGITRQTVHDYYTKGASVISKKTVK